jgi:hypothetical protein
VLNSKHLKFRTVRIDGGEKELLFIHGFGGNIEQPGVKWTMERFREADYSVTYVQLPTIIKNFNKDILKPVIEVRKGLERHVVAGFSLGGLTAAYLNDDTGKVYLSPFWGINERWAFKGLGGVLKVLAGFNKPSLKRHFDIEDAGPLGVDEDMNGIPDRVDPRTIHEMHHAQIRMPEPSPKDVVFYCPRDMVISIKEVEKRDIEKHTFRGGHMFYLSRDRKEIMDAIIKVLDRRSDHSHSAN